MIIRRRTYTSGFSHRYGYFMRSIGWYVGSYSTTDSAPTNIYTKCMQKESPSGYFPTNYRTDNYSYINSNTVSRPAVGYTDGTDIIVATATNLYRSSNGGASWTYLCKWNQDSYINRQCGPIVYMDATYIYVLYSSWESSHQATATLRLFKCSRSNPTFSTPGSLATNTSNNGYQFSIIDGFHYGLQVSPYGQVLITYQQSGNYWEVMMVDLKRGIASAPYQCRGEAEMSRFWQCSGQWYNDNSTYGAFFHFASYRTYSNGSATAECLNYYKTPGVQFSNGGAITVNSISTSSLGRIFSDNYIQYAGKPNYPNILIASCKDYKNKLFVAAWKGTSNDWAFYVCNSSFGSITKLSDLTSDMKNLLNLSSNPDDPRLSGLYVTPDGRYGVVLSVAGALVFDLENNVFIQGYKYAATESDYLNIGGQYVGFMTPK